MQDAAVPGNPLRAQTIRNAPQSARRDEDAA
jgi:hypothetical protein